MKKLKNKKYLLLYSGGVDSVVCLAKLVEQEIIPFIYHFRTLKLNNKHEWMIRQNARFISPKSSYYIFRTKTIDYVAYTSGDFSTYKICVGENDDDDHDFSPLDYTDYVVLGYTMWIYTEKKSRLKAQKIQAKFIKACRTHSLPYIFPIGTLQREQVDELFNNLPLKIRKNTVSSTRNYDYGGGVFVKSKS